MSNTQISDLTEAIIGSTIAEIDGGETDPALASLDVADQIERRKIFLRLEFQAEAKQEAARKLYLTHCLVRSIYSLVLAILVAGIFVTLTDPSALPWIVSGWIALTMAFLRTGGLTFQPRDTAQPSRDDRH